LSGKSPEQLFTFADLLRRSNATFSPHSAMQEQSRADSV
jgi:hypothetical protein